MVWGEGGQEEDFLKAFGGFPGFPGIPVSGGSETSQGTQWSSDAYFKERPKAGKLVETIVPILDKLLLKIGTFFGASCRADQGLKGAT